MAGKAVTLPADTLITTIETTKPRKIVQPGNRGALNSGGTPGNKGGPGRPPNELKAKWQKMLEDQAVDYAVKVILADPSHPQFTALYTKLSVMVVGLPGRQEDAADDAAIPHVHMDL